MRDLFKARTFLWSLLAFTLLITAMLVPMDWVRAFSGVFGGGEAREELSAFSPEVVELDERLAEDAPLGEPWVLKDGAETRERLEEARAYLQLRRLARAGPMTMSEMERAAAVLREFNAEIPRQEAEGSRRALKNERNRRILEAARRLDAEKVASELELLDDQLAQQGHVF